MARGIQRAIAKRAETKRPEEMHCYLEDMGRVLQTLFENKFRQIAGRNIDFFTFDLGKIPVKKYQKAINSALDEIKERNLLHDGIEKIVSGNQKYVGGAEYSICGQGTFSVTPYNQGTFLGELYVKNKHGKVVLLTVNYFKSK